MNDNESGFDDGAKLSALVRKARRRTIVRNASISLAITLLILAGGWFTNLQLQYRSSDNALRDIEMLKAISGPNQYIISSQINYGFLQGTLEYRTYKLVEGVPVIWGEETYEFSSWGSFSRPPGNYSDLSLLDPDMEAKGFHYSRPYNRYNGEREMLFYLPSVKYANYLNELPQLNDMDGRKLVEMSISFDKNYTVKQIKAMLPPGVHPVWYWVDTYSDMKPYTAAKMPDGSVVQPFPDWASKVYGFGVHPDSDDISEKSFLDALEYGVHNNRKYKQEFKRIYDYLRKDKEQPETSDIRLLGVVVTGTAEGLKALQGQPYVKAAVMGATVDR
ncbi:anti-sigma factor [Paenibacillus sp. XY044]|uniref:anti-sigma factor n=1 Tax=Paenibacillus sp. XY044 TaxID=2026089 RepID=UPI0015C67DFD|nr:anti-sigma factor [Paenibacillus sp. XY044]